MEPWKMAVIAALAIGTVGFGIVSNGGTTPVTPPPITGGTPAPTPTPGTPTIFKKYMGTTLPTYPSIKQWVNTPSPVNLSSLKGKPVLLEVFRIECSHCQEAAPFLVALHKRYAPRGVAFVGIQSPGDLTDASNPESNWTNVQAWIKAQGYTWPVGFDANSAWFQGKFGKGVSYPSMFLLDKNGNTVFIQSGHDSDEALQLAAELEHISPTQGDTMAQAKSLAQFLAPGNAAAVSKDLATRLGAIK